MMVRDNQQALSNETCLLVNVACFVIKVFNCFMRLTANRNKANKDYLPYLYHTSPQSLNFILHIQLNYSQYSINNIKFIVNKL